MSFLFEVFYFFKVLGVNKCDYIFFMLLDCILVSDIKNFVLININGDKLYCLKIWYVCMNFFYFYYGVYIVNSKDEIFYIGRDNDIKKILNFKEMIIFKWFKNYWNYCVYCFLFIGDLLVGVFISGIGMVCWYS